MASGFVLGSHYEAYVQQQVASGRYSDADDVLRAALRLLESEEELRSVRLAELQLAVRQGAESGAETPADVVLDRLEKKYEALARQKG